MPSLNIKDYIVAALLVILIGMGVVIFYDKARISYLESYKEKSEAIAEKQQLEIEKLKEESKKTEDYLNEKYEVDISILQRDINRLRERNTSILSSIPTSPENPDRICFQRAKLDEAIEQYREEVRGITEKGSRGISGLNICKEWIEKEQEIYGSNKE